MQNRAKLGEYAANRVAIALTIDLVLSTLAFFVWAWVELPRLGMSRWWWGLCAMAPWAGL